MPAEKTIVKQQHPAARFRRIELSYPNGFQIARRKANGPPNRPILPKRVWKDLPGWISLFAERGVARKCWNGCPLLPATHDGRRYDGCQIRGCTTKPQAGDPIQACTKCKWSVCQHCVDRSRMPTLAQDPLFHGPDDPCMLMYPQFEGMCGRGTVIVCPGGNYEFLSPLEGLPVVEWLASHGIGAVVLRYRLLPDYELDDCLDDLEAAAQRIRQIRSGPVAALGFSAGGHLIASLALRAARRNQRQPLDAQVLVYPGIDGKDWETEYNGFFNKGKWKIPKRAATLHTGQEDLLGGEGFSAPPTCLVGSTEDTCTPNEGHTDIYHAALEAREIPNLYLRDAFGEHGFELKGGWTPGCAKWLLSRGFGGPSQAPGVHQMSLRRPAPREADPLQPHSSMMDCSSSDHSKQPLPLEAPPGMFAPLELDDVLCGGSSSSSSQASSVVGLDDLPLGQGLAARAIAKRMTAAAGGGNDLASAFACTPCPPQASANLLGKKGKQAMGAPPSLQSSAPASTTATFSAAPSTKGTTSGKDALHHHPALVSTESFGSVSTQFGGSNTLPVAIGQLLPRVPTAFPNLPMGERKGGKANSSADMEVSLLKAKAKAKAGTKGGSNGKQQQQQQQHSSGKQHGHGAGSAGSGLVAATHPIGGASSDLAEGGAGSATVFDLNIASTGAFVSQPLFEASSDRSSPATGPDETSPEGFVVEV